MHENFPSFVRGTLIPITHHLSLILDLVLSSSCHHIQWKGVDSQNIICVTKRNTMHVYITMATIPNLKYNFK